MQSTTCAGAMLVRTSADSPRGWPLPLPVALSCVQCLVIERADHCAALAQPLEYLKALQRPWPLHRLFYAVMDRGVRVILTFGAISFSSDREMWVFRQRHRWETKATSTNRGAGIIFHWGNFLGNPVVSEVENKVSMVWYPRWTDIRLRLKRTRTRIPGD